MSTLNTVGRAAGFFSLTCVISAIDSCVSDSLRKELSERKTRHLAEASLQGDQDGVWNQASACFHYLCSLSYSIPIARVVAYFALSFFVPSGSSQETLRKISGSPSLFDLLKGGQIKELLEALESADVTRLDAFNFSSGGLPKAPKEIPNLRKFTRDLTLAAAHFELSPFSGRQEEMEQVAEILSCHGKSNPILLGAPGVGKTALAAGIAQRIIEGKGVPHIFKGKRVFSLEWDQISAGAERYGDDTVVKRLLGILYEAKRYRDQVILFIDEIHYFLGESDIMNILKPDLAAGTFNCIAATTNWDFEQLLNKDPALKRRFPQVEVVEPDDLQMAEMLHAVIPSLEAYHGVRISKEVVQEAISLSKSYLKSEKFPDKAIELLDRACSRLSTGLAWEAGGKVSRDQKLLEVLLRVRRLLQDEENELLISQKIEEVRRRFDIELTTDGVRQIVAERAGIPLDRMNESERERLLGLEERLGRNIIGQELAIRSLSQGVRCSRLRLGNPNRPAGVYLFLGSTGVGKTALAKAFSKVLYGDEDKHMLRVDMSEYDSHSSSKKLIGADPGYVGYEDGGSLVNWLRSHPSSIVLFDEIEKAHRSVFNIFLQLFDDARLTDNKGETIPCQDSTFIMTSNIGAEAIGETYGSVSHEELMQLVERHLREYMRPELINRIQEIVVFHPLNKEHIKQIALYQCEVFRERVKQNTEFKGIDAQWDDTVIDYLVKYGFSPKFGARELERCITRNLERPLADLLIKLGEKVQPGDRFLFQSNAELTKITLQWSGESSLADSSSAASVES